MTLQITFLTMQQVSNRLHLVKQCKSIDLSSDFSAHAYCKPGFGKAQMYLCVRFISCIVGVHFRFPVDLTTHYYISADTKNGTLARLYVIG